jgi:hypothetical protein
VFIVQFKTVPSSIFLAKLLKEKKNFQWKFLFRRCFIKLYRSIFGMIFILISLNKKQFNVINSSCFQRIHCWDKTKSSRSTLSFSWEIKDLKSYKLILWFAKQLNRMKSGINTQLRTYVVNQKPKDIHACVLPRFWKRFN